MTSETRIEKRLSRWVARATTPRGAAIVIATVTTAITFVAALVMMLVDRDNYPTFGSGLWFAIQTTTTVGYGDNVPTTVAGRFFAALVMLFGIGFLTVITAAITSAFIARARREFAASDDAAPTAEQMRQLVQRLERIEAAVTDKA